MEVLSFFPRQTLTGTSGTATVYYSEIFDVTAYSHITVELRIYEGNATTAPTTLTLELQTTSDPTFTDDPSPGLAWQKLTTAPDDPITLAANAAGKKVERTLQTPARFLRCKISMPTGSNSQVTLMVAGVARGGV